ncbi:hypothetical protein [Tengunoibacter tsumagoiensis]|uniref:Histidine kinase N-terminal 7TM region domain-containing protein n=1 Tax=Tengunoibacter tsumagoiensis TaxID=2014871 RepID=A0A401ZUH9_9CHLR|nr:hypothetical protein [Tengunoibacter tsumagoiensis]GCE10487.1 hypothetical protein KTT_03460 [Tengunoibacter tsumagoiensis]
MFDFILFIHHYNVYLILVAALVAGIWGLVLYFRHLPADRAWRITLIVSVALGILQGLLGLIMVLLGKKPAGGEGLFYLHYVYGGIVALAVPFAWLSYTSNEKNQRKIVLFYSIAALVMVAAGVRGWMTGPVVFPSW